jgi:hypothetical protein
MHEVGKHFCEAIVDFCDPDQSKVKKVLRVLENMYPSGEIINDNSEGENSDGGGKKAKKSNSEKEDNKNVDKNKSTGWNVTPSNPNNGAGKQAENKGLIKPPLDKRNSLPLQQPSNGKVADNKPKILLGSGTTANVKRDSSSGPYEKKRSDSANSGKESDKKQQNR